MFNDQKKELARLEEELLKDRELYDPELPEEFEEVSGEYEEAVIAEHPDAWNTNNTDADLEQLSRDVYDAPRKGSPNLLGIAAGLLLLAALLGWMVMRQRGLLP